MSNSKDVLSFIFEEAPIPLCIAGPCAVEGYEMMEDIVKYLVSRGIYTIRAGVFKPRTNPEDFQGLGLEALCILKEIKKKYHVTIVSEIVDAKYLNCMLETVDILQVGARNMHNYELLKILGQVRQPILLKRGFSATIHEFISAAGYIVKGGNQRIILCERGIRSFDPSTRNLLDLASVAIIKKEYGFPVIVDISHSLGRKDIAIPVAKAALAVGADGIMVEVHTNPAKALSDVNQQMDIFEFDHFYNRLQYYCENL